MTTKEDSGKSNAPVGATGELPHTTLEDSRATRSDNRSLESSGPEAPAQNDPIVSEGDRQRHRGCVVVGIGASAGGLEAFKELLGSIPANTGMAFVLVQHLDPTHESMMVELLSKYTPMPVLQVENATPIQPNHIYMIPPNKFLKVSAGGLFLDEPIIKRGVRLPIDYFFASLAQAREERAVCVVLSGTGSDGADGIREVKGHGGITIVQKPETAEYNGMPRAAINTGAVDFILPISEIAEVLIPYAQHPYVQSKAKATLAESAPDHFRTIIALLHAHTDHDFSRYKTGTLTRRIDRRMGIHHIAKAADYLKLLREDRGELHELFKDMLIGVTRFFRDARSWEELSSILASDILKKREGEPFRVWVPGCSTGEEAYSIAIMLHELQLRHKRRLDFQVFATDIDTDSIDVARLGIYPENITKDLPDEYLDTYFQREGEKLRVRKKLRESCIFAVQNVLSDPPFSNLDLISCRNLLIYLESDIQVRVFDMMHFALKPRGILLLGSSESPSKRKQLFEVVSQSSRIYRKFGESKSGGRDFVVNAQNKATTELEHDGLSGGAYGKPVGAVEASRRALLEAFAPASVVVNSRGLIQYIHGPVRNYLDFPSGEPDLEVGSMAQNGLKAKVRHALQQCRSTQTTYFTIAPRVARDNRFVSVRVQVAQLALGRGAEPLYLVSFIDEPVPTALPDAATGSAAEVQPDQTGNEQTSLIEVAGDSDRQLMLELQSMREDLQSTIEELESANEELKASHEEVMSMNEELQSTNEELETSREELQSLNEELSTVNNQLHDKVEELEASTNDLSNLLSSTEMATLFLDSDLRIRRFTPATCRLMHILDTDIGRPVSDLSPRVNDPDLVKDAREVLDLLSPIEREVDSGDARWFMRRILPFRTADNKIEGVVVIYADISQVKQAMQKLAARERQQAAIAQLGRKGLVDENLQSLFEQAVEALTETLEIPLAKVLRLKEGGRHLELLAGVGWRDNLVGNAEVSTGVGSQAGYTLQSSTAVIVEDLRTEKRFSGPALLTEHGVVSGMSVIIGPEHEPWGVLGAHTDRHVEFTIDDTNFMVAVANVLWEAIERRRGQALVEHRLAEIDGIYQSAPMGLCFIDSRMRYVRVNAGLATINGRSIEEHEGRTLRDVVPDMAPILEPIFNQVLSTGTPALNVEVDGVAPGEPGVKKHWLVSFSPTVVDDQVAGINTAVMDITERKTAAKALAESEVRLQRLVSAAAIGIAFVNRKGQLFHANDAMLAILEISREDYQAQGWDWADTTLPNGSSLAETLQRLAQSGAAEPIEFRRTELNTDSMWVLTSVNPLDDEDAEYVVLMADISGQKRAETALYESEERMRLAASLAEFGTYYGEVATGKLHWSPEMKDIFGIARDEPVPVNVGGIPGVVHEDDRERMAVKFQASLDPAGDGNFHDEVRVIRPGGAQRWVLLQGRTVFRHRGEQREPIRVAGVGLDITDRHQFEERLRAAQHSAEEASEAKSRFLANMSHEIRTPMTAILGYADVLDVRLDDTDAKACVKTIKENGAYLCDILDDILDLSRVESGKVTVRPESFSLLSILAEMRSLMTVRATQKSLNLSLEFDGMIPETLLSDPKLVRQVLVNLVGNAIKFTEGGGVTVLTRCLKDSEEIEICVIDTGVGIAADQTSRLFEPFEQVDNSLTRAAGGTGLGLAICKHLVELLGGRLLLDSEVDKGSTFSFTFKCGSLDNVEWVEPDPAALRDIASLVENKSAPRISGQVLAADDRPEIRILIREFIEAAGADISMHENGQKLVDAYQDLHNRSIAVDAILMDLQMPVMDGFEATARLRAEGFKGPIIALTANVMQGDRDRCLKAGFDAFVTKPIDRVELISELARQMSSANNSEQRSPLCVLCIEDDVASSHAQGLLLKYRGFEVQSAGSKSEALKLVETFTPDVALIDLGLPDGSGHELMLQLKSKSTLVNTAYICVTGRDEESIDWQELGFDHFLQKPVNIDILAELINESRDHN